ncbi:MAG: ArnT family glycosyltransferase [Vicinamibacterales bacterium]
MRLYRLLPSRLPPLPRWARAADALTLTLLLVSPIVAATGGFRTDVFGLRLSVRSVDRLILLALIVAALRHWRVRSPTLLQRLRSFPARVPEDADDRAPLAPDEHALVPAERRSWRRAALEFAGLLIGYGALVAVMTWPQAGQLDTAPDLGDPLFSTWRLAWIAHQIVRDPLHLFDGNIFHPERLTLTYSDSHIVPGLMAAPFLWMGAHQFVVYNVLFLAAFALSGATMFVLARSLTGRADAALVAGVLFALYPYRFEHYSHLELQVTFWMPLLLLAIHRAFKGGRLRDGLAAGLLMGLQTLSSLYYGVFLTVFLIPVCGALWLHSRVARRAVRGLIAGAVVAAVMIAPVAAAYVANRSMVGKRPFGVVESYSPQGSDYLVAHWRSARYGEIEAEHRPECELFPTVTPVALALTGMWPPLSAARIGYVTALALAFDASLGVNGSVYRLLYEYAPGFRALRVPARFSLLVGMTLTILAGYGIARLTRGRGPVARWTIAALAVAIAIFEMQPRNILVPVWMEPPPIYASLPNEPGVVLAELPMPTDEGGIWVDARSDYNSTFHWRKVVNGASGHFPDSYLQLFARLQEFPADNAMAYLRERGVTHVAVHQTFYIHDRYARVVRELDARTDVALVASGPFRGGESRLYRLVR